MANAKDPVKLTDGQLDNFTAGATNVSSGLSGTTTTTSTNSTTITSTSSTTSAAGGAGSSFNTASLTGNTITQTPTKANVGGAVSMAPYSMKGQGILQANPNTGANAVQQNSVALTFGFIPAITTP
jgi:hypothetical protein